MVLHVAATGAHAADDIEREHAVDLATEVVLRLLAPEAAESGASRIRQEMRPAPDTEREDRVMLHRSRLSRIYDD